jgi:hypothetical protein
MDGAARGGDDQIFGGSGPDSGSLLFGDAFIAMNGSTRGGNDVIRAGTSLFGSVLAGDSGAMGGDARGGDDSLYGGLGADYVIGDAPTMSGNARGGDDRLDGGGGDDRLFGDAEFLTGSARGGHDIFVFSAAAIGSGTVSSDFGNDEVGDFRQGEDRLEFDIPGVAGIGDLQIVLAGINTVVTVPGHGTVTLDNFTGTLTTSDLMFT